jgi:membrane-associated phospholipid phosphatase
MQSLIEGRYMTQRHDLAAEAIQRGAIPGRGYAVARVVSQVLHPVVLSIVSIFIIGWLGIQSRAVGLGWAAVVTLLQVLPPTIFFTIRLRQGAYTDEDISQRHQRNELYLFGMVNVVVVTALLAVWQAPAPVLAVMVSAGVLNIVAWIINLFWKISVHSAGIGSCATIAALYSEPLGLVLWIAALTLGWARVRTRNHTPMQVAAGLALAATTVLATFIGFGLV